MSKNDLLYHTIPPVFDSHSKVLVLGSFPSPKSREASFYYAHPQNRFWPVLAKVYATQRPVTIEEKKRFLLTRSIALWDVLASCTIQNADDASIRDFMANDLSVLLDAADIRAVFTTGGKAQQLYTRLCLPITHIQVVALPSTSPANCRCTFDRLVEEYSVIKEFTQ